MVSGTRGARALPDWDRGGSETRARAVAQAWIAPVVLVALGLGALWSWWASAALVAAAGIATVAVPTLQLRRLLARFGAPLNDGPLPARVENLVRGIAADHRLVTPRVVVLGNCPPNAFVWRPLAGRPAVAISQSYLEALSLTELEGVVAHCLVRLARSDATTATLAAPFGRLGARIAPRVGVDADVRAAALTRYPPGIAAAIEKATPMSVAAPLWLVSEGPSHLPAGERMAELRTL